MTKLRAALIVTALLAWPWNQALAVDACADGALSPARIGPERTLQLSWIGKVNGRMAGDIEQAFEGQRRRVAAVELALQSCGGGTDDMSATINVLRHIQETHPLTTVVLRGATCASACVPIFLAAERRRAAMSSLWYFHRSWRHQLSGSVDAVETSRPSVQSMRPFLDRYYAPAGVSRRWLEKLSEIIDNSGGYWQTGRELWQAKTGIATEVIGDVEPKADPRIYLAPAPGCSAMCRG